MGTRTREECVVKFLQLEIEDKYLEPAASGPSYGRLDQGRVPFDQADNPVLSVLGYLTSLSEPAVAAAAAGRSIDQMAKLRRKRLEAGQGGPDQEHARISEDPMDIDAKVTAVSRVEEAAARPPSDPMQEIANATFAASAARAAALASNEEREMTRLVSAAVNITLEKMELKLQQFSELEATLQKERRGLERGRQELFLDRLAFRKRVIETQEALKNASLKGGEEGVKMANDVKVGGHSEKLAFVKEGRPSDAAGAGEPPSGGVNFEI